VITIRVEDGRLDELAITLDGILLKGVGAKLAPGSVVMLGSISHLDSVGLETYALDLARTLEVVGAKVGGVYMSPRQF
jgi:hypothetical protein